MMPKKMVDRLAAFESACTGVSFVGDPIGAVKALAKALEPFAEYAKVETSKDDGVILTFLGGWYEDVRHITLGDCRAALVALACVRVDGNTERSHERSHRAILRESGIIVDDGDGEG